MLYLMACAVSEITFLVHKFSRFSEEIFTGIVAIFFTYETVKTIMGVSVSSSYPLHIYNVLETIDGHVDL